jgi:endonuclease VIII
MPEGHTIRHLADVHAAHFGGKVLQASSPQGRFATEAWTISGREMTDVTARGKHLFFHFDGDVVHIHLGLYGWFTLVPGVAPKPKDTVRLRLQNDDTTSDLIGPTKCELLTETGRHKIIERLGVDPISYDPTTDEELRERKFHKILSSKKSIAELLMDQSIIAGIGNVYRAEILFRAGQNPFTPGRELMPEILDAMWDDARRLLKLGAEDGMIRAVEPEHLLNEEQRRYKYGQFSYVYKRNGQLCRICGGVIESISLGNRTVYWCPGCQE